MDNYDKATQADIDKRTAKIESGCWIYTGFINVLGYGQIGYRGKSVPVHRLVYHLKIEPLIGIDFGTRVEIHHICRVKACVNPDHLQKVYPHDHRRLHNVGKSRKAKESYVPTAKEKAAMKAQSDLVIKRYGESLK